MCEIHGVLLGVGFIDKYLPFLQTTPNEVIYRNMNEMLESFQHLNWQLCKYVWELWMGLNQRSILTLT